MRRLVTLTLTIAATTAALAGCGSDSSPATGGGQAQTTSVRDVDSVLTLRAAFNADRGSPRLLLLLSPT